MNEDDDNGLRAIRARVFDIEWDTDGATITNLPTELEVDIQINDDSSGEDMEYGALAAAQSVTGLPILSANVEMIG